MRFHGPKRGRVWQRAEPAGWVFNESHQAPVAARMHAPRAMSWSVRRHLLAERDFHHIPHWETAARVDAPFNDSPRRVKAPLRRIETQHGAEPRLWVPVTSFASRATARVERTPGIVREAVTENHLCAVELSLAELG